jgi:hypothetical protein
VLGVSLCYVVVEEVMLTTGSDRMGIVAGSVGPGTNCSEADGGKTANLTRWLMPPTSASPVSTVEKNGKKVNVPPIPD